jgi:solute:Na+ symporter, SSS family
MIYCLLFATGYFIYGNLQLGGILTVIALISAYLLSNLWSRIKVDVL